MLNVNLLTYIETISAIPSNTCYALSFHSVLMVKVMAHFLTQLSTPPHGKKGQYSMPTLSNNSQLLRMGNDADNFSVLTSTVNVRNKSLESCRSSLCKEQQNSNEAHLYTL